MPLLLIGLILLLPLAFVLLLPFSLLQRYRAGTARRMGRSWVTKLNLFLLGFSAIIFVLAATVTNLWVPGALRHALLGLGGGVVLGVIALMFTRWESGARGLHYTPPRLLVLLITLAVAIRVVYGFVRAWEAWRNPELSGTWLAAAGAAGSLAIGGMVLGYYLTYSGGVTRRLKRHGRLQVISVK